jgi:hypothetical protein
MAPFFHFDFSPPINYKNLPTSVMIGRKTHGARSISKS